MADVSDDAALRGLRLKKKNNAYKAVDEVLSKSKSVEGISEEEMERMREELEPSLKEFEHNVNEHLKML